MLRKQEWLAGLIVVAIQACTRIASEDHADPNAAARASEALKAALKLECFCGKEVTKLLLEQRFEEFESRSTRYEHQFELEPLWEKPLSKLYSGIDGGNAELREKLDKWVQLRPSYMAYTARGAYEVNLAYEQRGSRYIQETPAENLAKMSASLAKAQEDLDRALAANAAFVPAYIELLAVAQAMGDVESAAAIEKRATSRVPTTYYVRYSYLVNLRPRWGGSYELMTAYEEGLTSAARLNPRIWSLKGESWAERGYTARLDRDERGAIKFYTKALEYGDRLEFLKARGTLYLDSHQYDLALKDFTRFREYDATDDEVNRDTRCVVELRSGRPCESGGGSPGAPAP